MKFILDRITHNKETVKDVFYDNPYSFGRIAVNDKCNGCGKCKASCVVNAINIGDGSLQIDYIRDGSLQIDYNKCIYCNNCIDACEFGALKNTHDYKMASIEKAGLELKDKIYSKFNRSLVLRSVDTGSCNACMLELSAMQNTYYDLSRFGVNFAASPRHADGIVVTGPVSINMKEALIKTYKAIPEPRIVIAAGSCAYDGGIFKHGYGNIEQLNKIVPVDLVIPGCPPSPQAMIYGLLKLMDRI